LSLLVSAALLSAMQSRAATEMEERAAISSATQSAFVLEDFSRLEEASDGYRRTKSRTPSGLWKLTLFQAAIYGAIRESARGRERETAFRDLESKTTRWVQRYPNSPSAHIAHSSVFIQHAWAIRGSGYASTVKPEAWEPFRRYIAMARANLETHKSIAAVDPRWYELMLSVARDESWERDEFDRLLDEALNREPLFYQTYFLALEYLLPKWHGGKHDIEDFARRAVERTSSQEGQGMYARIYWFASQAQFKNQLFSDSMVVWPHMKSGFDDVIARYPDAWNLNNYAKFACLAGDKAKARELLERIKSAIVAEAWQPHAMLERCAEWASQT
ncbi:MAG: cytoplasmic protein, partial [Verrucomicrobia bacterium]